MFARKIKYGFYKILPKRKARTSSNIPMNKYLNLEKKNSSICSKEENNYDGIFIRRTNIEKIPDSRG